MIAITKELNPGETRVAATPATVKEYIKAGLQVKVESGAGDNAFFRDNDYKDAGAEIVTDVQSLLATADIVIKVTSPTLSEIEHMKKESILVSLFQPTIEVEKVKTLAERSITGFSMHLIPRTTLAQKMDALSSQANISGYKAVLMGATHISIYMPLLMTAAGTIRPARVLVLGAGVAGLQAIATAKRLGARVETFDVRPEVKEQVESLGAKFIEVESGSDEGVGEGGYAKETSEKYKNKQQTLIREHIALADMVVTTALVPGKPAPILISKDVVQIMKPGSVIMDLAAENGGNCELTIKDQITEHHQVIIDGTSNIPATMPVHASELYAKNIAAFLTYMIQDGKLNLNLDDEIISGSMFTHSGEITHDPTLTAIKDT
ncbi:MAG: Re/Si-specific NAD(P)(+) transhydrogenase subunit alpha [Candidatus Neomarinimicrobiota bacterium]|nr:Re/Si-specific NAD(P)(+) transhydrogenase subunit alpha [Candidatus Neomarinimicrobiota bacterium]